MDTPQFIEHRAVGRQLAAATQNQALAAILFLYRDVLRVETDYVDDVVRAQRPARLPVVLSTREVRSVLALRDGNGQRDRVTMLPAALVDDVRRAIVRARETHARELARGFGRAPLPRPAYRQHRTLPRP